MMLVSFFSLLFSFGIIVSGFDVRLLRSTMMSDGLSLPFWPMRSKTSLSVLTNSTFTPSLRAVSLRTGHRQKRKYARARRREPAGEQSRQP